MNSISAQIGQTGLALLALTTTLFAWVPAAMADEPTSAEAIRAVLSEQTRAWNHGDIAGFMDHYWKSAQLTFSSGGNTTRGWQATLDRYEKRYATRDQMGQLAFADLEIMSLGDAHALVLGTWHLERGDDSVGGNFSLVFAKHAEKWVIVHDHTSVRQDDEKNS